MPSCNNPKRKDFFSMLSKAYEKELPNSLWDQIIQEEITSSVKSTEPSSEPSSPFLTYSKSMEAAKATLALDYVDPPWNSSFDKKKLDALMDYIMKDVLLFGTSGLFAHLTTSSNVDPTVAKERIFPSEFLKEHYGLMEWTYARVPQAAKHFFFLPHDMGGMWRERQVVRVRVEIEAGEPNFLPADEASWMTAVKWELDCCTTF